MSTRHLAEKVLNASVNAHAALLNGGFLDLYDGPQPTSTALAPTKANKRLATMTFAAQAFKPAKDGVAESNDLGADTDAANTGTATWYRMTEADHKTVVEDGSVGREKGDLLMNATGIQQHAEVRILRVVLKAKG